VSPFEPWIGLAVGSAFLQCIRTAQQQRLRGLMSVNAAGFVRYLFGAPVAAAIVALACLQQGALPPVPGGTAMLAILCGGTSQVLATNLLILSFGYRNFAVGTAYSKTEAMQTALFGAAILGEHLGPAPWIGIAVGFLGVVVLSLPGGLARLPELARSITHPSALCGLGSGALFGVSGIAFRIAGLDLSHGDAVLRGSTILLATTLFQTILQGGWMALTEPAQLAMPFRHFRSSVVVGVLSALGSAGWFTAFTLAPVALIRAVGQVELVFTFLIARVWLGERATLREVGGAALIVSGVVVVLLGR